VEAFFRERSSTLAGFALYCTDEDSRIYIVVRICLAEIVERVHRNEHDLYPGVSENHPGYGPADPVPLGKVSLCSGKIVLFIN